MGCGEEPKAKEGGLSAADMPVWGCCQTWLAKSLKGCCTRKLVV
jgi:hypothetical protein